uniref:Uncharacterized protein n=1 Tax=Acanthochromis polyacanthus TaxID=80966 RepID=A0A3Q1FR73_9TELE
MHRSCKDTPSSTSGSDSDSEAETKEKRKKSSAPEKPVKKPKHGESSKPGGSSKGGSNGDDNMLQIGKMRYVHVRDFKGKVLTDIRDPEQWNQLKDQTSETDNTIKRV